MYGRAQVKGRNAYNEWDDVDGETKVENESQAI